MGKKNVLFVTQELPPLFLNGGAGTAVLAQATLLAATSEFEVTVLYTSFVSFEKKHKNSISRNLLKIGIRLLFLQDISDIRNWNNDGRYKSLAIYHYLSKSNYDLAYFNDFDGLAFYSIAARKTQLSLPSTTICIICHGNTSWGIKINSQMASDLDLVTIDMEIYSMRNADFLISPSRYLANWNALNLQMEDCKFEILRNVFPNVQSHKKVNDKPTDNPGVKKLVFFGRQEIRKGFILFVKVVHTLLEKYDNIEIYFLGKSQIIEGLDSESLARNYLGKYADKIHFLGALDRPEVKAFLSSEFTLAIMPSLDENLSYSVFECIQWNVNFIATNVGGTSELISHESSSNVLVNPDKNSILERIESWLNGSQVLNADLAFDSDQVAQEFVNKAKEMTIESVKKEIIISESAKHLVTFCIVHHNRSAFLSELLEKLRKQIHKNFEVIVVDDGSTNLKDIQFIDNLQKLSTNYGYEIKVLYTPDIGLSGARNWAIKNSKSEFMIFFDDDNLPNDNFINTMLRGILASNADACVSLTNSFTKSVNLDGEVSLDNIEYLPIGAARLSGFYSNLFGDSHAIWKMDSLRKLDGFPRNFIEAEDWQLYASATLANMNIQIIPGVLYHYRKHQGSLSFRTPLRNNYQHEVAEIYRAKIDFSFWQLIGSYKVSHRNVASENLASIVKVIKNYDADSHDSHSKINKKGVDILLGSLTSKVLGFIFDLFFRKTLVGKSNSILGLKSKVKVYLAYYGSLDLLKMSLRVIHIVMRESLYIRKFRFGTSRMYSLTDNMSPIGGLFSTKLIYNPYNELKSISIKSISEADVLINDVTFELNPGANYINIGQFLKLDQSTGVNTIQIKPHIESGERLFLVGFRGAIRI